MFKYISNKKFIFLAIILLVQQLMVAYGTFALIMAGKEIGNNHRIILWLFLFLLIFLLSPLITILSKKIETQISYSGFIEYLHQHLFVKSGQSRCWQSTQSKETFLTSTGIEAENYLSANIFVVSDLLTYSFSIILNGLVIGYTIDSKFLISYLVSVILCGLFFNFFKSRFESFNELEQHQRGLLNNILLKSWDLLLLNNEFLIQRSRNVIHKRMTNAMVASEKAVVNNELMVNVLFMLAILPVAITSMQVITNNLNNNTILIALLASIPRKLQVLGIFRSVFQTLNSLIAFNSKLNVLIQGVNIESKNIENQIQTQKIKINDQQFSQVRDILNFFDGKQGRYTIRGENGSGKSSLLLLINELRPNSILVPTNPQFIDENGNEITGSTGQKIVQIIEMIKSEKFDLLLLDEWDAHTDHENSLLINSMIDQLSKEKVVIEVKHRV